MSLELRRLRPGEGELYREVRLESLRESPGAFGSTLESALARSPASWQEQADSSSQGTDRVTYLALVQGSPIGLAALYRDAALPGTGELLQVWVAPAHRGGQAAAALLHTVLAWAWAQDFLTIRAEVLPDNLRALRFYRKHGFMPQPPASSSNTPGNAVLFLDRPPVSASATNAK